MSYRHVIKGIVKQYLPDKLNHFRVIEKDECTYVDIKEHGGSEEVTDITIVSEQVPIEETEWYKEQAFGLAYYEDVLVVFKGPKEDIPHLEIKEGTSAIVSRACAGLTKTEIDIPDSVEKIGEDAFKDVPNINYHGNALGSPWGAKCVNGCINGDFVFSDATKTKVVGYIGSETTIIIPQGVKEIGDKAFYYEIHVQSIDIPDTVEKIGQNAFSGCEKLSSIRIPNGVTKIDDYAFSWCRLLENIEIPNSVKSIGSHAFNCCHSIKHIVIPEDVKEIGRSAFSRCDSLLSISIPNSITKIENGTFNGCKSLESIDIPETVEEIGWSAFEDCQALRSIKIPNGNKKIGAHAFDCCDSLLSISIPEGITEIKENTFYNCTSLESVGIPETVEEIGRSAFEGCQALRSIRIPNGIKRNGYTVFKDCKSLESVDIPNLPSTKLGCKWDFRDCDNLKCINIYQVSDERNIWNIVQCGKNVEIQFIEEEKPSTVVDKPSTVAEKSFLGKIYHYLFARKKKLALKPTSSKINQSEVVPDTNEGYKKMKKFIIAFLLFLPLIAGAKSFVEKVGDVYFLVMPHNNTCWVTYVPEGYPEYSGDITIPSSIEHRGVTYRVTEIEMLAFANYQKVTSITISEGVKKIQTSAFYGCSALQKVHLPATITEIEPDAFGECSKLGLVRCDALYAPEATDAFTNTQTERIQLIVPSSATQSYKDSSVWKEFLFTE